MNENTTAIDDETLSRAVLTYCLDSADAMMYALVKGIGSATHTLQLLADSGPGNHESVATAAYKTLDAALINGITRWGRGAHQRHYTLGTHHQCSRYGLLPRRNGLVAASPDHIAQHRPRGAQNVVHRKRHAVDRRAASPLLAFAACRPHHTHGLGRAIMPMGER